MASDHQYNHTGGMTFKGMAKMMVLQKEIANLLFNAKKAIVGGAGNAQELGQAWSWLADPQDKFQKVKGSEFVAVTSNKEIYTSFNLINWIKVEQDYYAIGSGMHFAVAALESGKSPVKAVEIATKFDPHTGHGVTEYKL